MPIKGMTDRGASFPRIGELRKGAEKPASGNKPGADLKHFRFTSKNPDVERKFYDEYGASPVAINCYLPYSTALENFEAWIEEWVAGGLKWRGDGESLVVWQKSDGTYSQEPKPQPDGGKQVGRLKVIIPELGRLAYVVALTTSTHDIVDMSGVLEAYEAMRGNLQGIPFILSRVPRMVSTPGTDGKRVRREKWLWHLEAQPVWVQAQLSVMQRAALPSGNYAMLDDGIIADIETGEIMDDDFEQVEQTENDTPELDDDTLTLIADCRVWLEDKFQDGKTNLGMALDAAAMTPLYEVWKHAHNALVGDDGYDFPEGFKVDRKQVITAEGALKIYDWLMARKAD